MDDAKELSTYIDMGGMPSAMEEKRLAAVVEPKTGANYVCDNCGKDSGTPMPKRASSNLWMCDECTADLAE